jgi:hypothetical protein
LSVPITLVGDRLGKVNIPLLVKVSGTEQPPMKATIEVFVCAHSCTHVCLRVPLAIFYRSVPPSSLLCLRRCYVSPPWCNPACRRLLWGPEW